MRDWEAIKITGVGAAAMLAYGAVILAIMSGMDFVPPLAAACAIFAITKWINRRDDPRNAKRPPDAP